MPKNPVWSCTVRLVAREWKEELYTEEIDESALLSTFGRMQLVARAAGHADADIQRIEYSSGPVLLMPTAESPGYYGYRYFVFTTDGQKNEWELRCVKNE